jgi:hypothetical protein
VIAQEAATCIGFHVPCDTMLKGSIGTVMGIVLFIGTVLLLLSAVFGRLMGYLVLAVSLFGWMIVFSALWTFGFYSQGLDTQNNLGPRGEEAGWVVAAAGQNLTDVEHEEFATYPEEGWRDPAAGQRTSISSAIQSYLAEQANEEAGLGEFDPGAFTTTNFAVEDVATTTAEDGTQLAAGRGYYTGGGPLTTVFLEFGAGSVSRYSWMFLIGSTILFAVHLPFLDRAERRRKEILTGGTAPPWYGPA